MSEEAIEAGSEFGVIVIDALQRVGLPSQGRPAFYATEIGIQLGHIAADIGVDATLVIMDVLREQVALLPSTRH